MSCLEKHIVEGTGVAPDKYWVSQRDGGGLTLPDLDGEWWVESMEHSCPVAGHVRHRIVLFRPIDEKYQWDAPPA